MQEHDRTRNLIAETLLSVCQGRKQHTTRSNSRIHLVRVNALNSLTYFVTLHSYHYLA